MDNVSFTPDINETQTEQAAMSIEQQLTSQDIPQLPEERYAGLSAWAARKAIKAAKTTEPPEKSISDMILRYGQEPIDTEQATLKTVDPIRPEQMAEPVPLVPRPTISEQKMALNIADSDLSQYSTTDSFQMNFDTIDQPDDVKSVIAFMADANSAVIDEARRGVVADEQLRGLADDLGQSEEFIRNVLEREQGGMLNAEQILAARQVLEQSAVKLKELAIAVNNDQTSDQAKAKFARQFHFHNAFQAQFMGARAEYGRGMRALGIKTEGSDAIQAEHIAAIATQMNRGINIEKIAASIATVDTTKGINATVQAADPSNWSKAWDSLYEVFINGILSGVSTHIVNNLGSAIRIGVDVVDTKIASLMGSWNADGFDRIGGDEWKAKLFAEMSGFNESFDVMWKAMKTAEPYQGIQKADHLDHRAITAENYGIDPNSMFGGFVDFSGKVLRSPTERLMGGSDAFWKKMAERGAIAQLAFRRVNVLAKQYNWDNEKAKQELIKLIENPTSEMREQALNESLEMTFQSPLGKTGQKFQTWVQGAPGARWVLPFIKTPANLLKQAYLERTPLGLLAKQYRQDVMSGGARGQLARSKMLTGTALMTMAFYMAREGMITGSDHKDPDVSKKRREAGWRPRSIVIDTPTGKQYISYDRLEPFSYIIGAAADIAEYMDETRYTVLGEEEEAALDRMIDAAVLAAAENTLNKTFMTGVRDLMNVWTDPKRYGERYIQNQLDAMTPFSGLRRNIKRTLDDERTIPADSIGKHLEEQWAILSSNTPKAVDSFGKVVKYDRVLMPWTNIMETRSRVRREVMRLAETTRKSAIPEFSAMVSGYKLKNEEYVKMKVYSRKDQVIAGKSFIDAMTELIDSTAYNSVIDDDKVEMMRNLTMKYDEAAKSHFRSDDNTLYNKMLQKDLIRPAKYLAKEKGISEEQALEELKTKYGR